MKVTVNYCLLLLCLCTYLSGQSQIDLQSQQAEFVEKMINQPTSATILHYIEHIEEENGIILSSKQKNKIVEQYHISSFYSENRIAFERINIESLYADSVIPTDCEMTDETRLSCLNGGFEDDFEEFLYRGDWPYSNMGPNCTPNVNLGDYEDIVGTEIVTRLKIVDDQQDAVIPILNQVEFDDQAARINSYENSIEPDGVGNYNREVDQLAKRFLVTEETADFTIHYAVVLQNPTGHVNSQPFFKIEILGGPDFLTVIDQFCFDAENDDELVTFPNPVHPPGVSFDGSPVKFKDWDCWKSDLKDYIGCEVILEVTTGDCGQSAHFGYSYVDGICEPCEDGPGEEYVFIKEVGPCIDNTVTICGFFDLPEEDLVLLELKGDGFELTLDEFTIIGNEFCVTVTEQDYIDAGITGCLDLVVTGLFVVDDEIITSVSDEFELCLEDLQCDESCIEYVITDIECINNGTADPTDDQWTFTINVTSSSANGCGYFYTEGDVTEAGPLGINKIIYMGDIADYGSTANFTTFDGCDKECYVEVSIDVPEPCSVDCKLEAEIKEISDCKDNGEYSVTVNVTGSDGECWMAIIKYANGDEELIGTYSGDGSFTFDGFNTIDGDFVLWIKKCDYFDCVIDLFVKAPDCCLAVNIANVICINNGTTDPSDDQWTFDIFVTSNSDETCNYWKTFGDVDEAGSMGEWKTIWMGQITDYGATATFTVYDGCDENCNLVVEIEVPEPCSAPCKLEAAIKEISDCKDNGEYGVTITVEGSGDDCWMAILKHSDGTEEVIGTYSGDGVFDLGPFDSGDGDFVLWIKKCDYFDCVLDLFVKAPECCLEVDIANVICLNNGTADPSDDQWTFDIFVLSNSDKSCNYWKTDGDVDEAGSMGEWKTIWMGQISNYGSTANFTVYDGCDEDCSQEIELNVPSTCSPECKLELKDYKVGECKDGVYYVTVTVTGTDGGCWMAKQKKSNGDEVVVGTYYGDGTYDLGPFDPADGDFTLWIKMCEQFDCLLDKYIFAPSCGGLMDVKSRSDVQQSIILYPNPSFNVLNIDLAVHNIDASYRLEFLNVQGQTIKLVDVNDSGTLQVNISSFNDGVYLVRLTENGQFPVIRKFVKM
ncbi:T9SS type A sorting domain-containing protein [Saprospiraceae bacterium]|nr:T9SS type A sorting domain-containing protein [Saprospiraceae bacterium]